MTVEAFEQAQQRVLERYGVPAESRFVDVAICRGQAHALVGGEGPPMVLLNGIGTPAAMYAPLMAELEGVRYYAVDLPGYGLTDAPPDFSADLRNSAVRFILEVLDGLGLDSPVIMANSLGALWSSWFAIDYPDRVAGMVHIGCPALLLDTSAPMPMRLLSVGWLGRLMMRIQPPSPKQVESLSKMAGEYPMPPEIAALLLATERLPGSDETFRSMLSKLVRPRGSRPELRLNEEQLAQIGQPLLYIWGDNDPFGSVETGRQAARIVPNATFHVVEGGHVPWLRSTDEAGVLTNQFLDDLHTMQ